MHLYLIKRIGETGYDQFSSAVVVASSPEAARLIHPRQSRNPWNGKPENEFDDCWVLPSQVEAYEIGAALPPFDTPGTVICANFRAG